MHDLPIEPEASAEDVITEECLAEYHQGQSFFYQQLLASVYDAAKPTRG